ncbi:hypothetical protein OS493_035170 [Desmophyllum pertusum]|uniref:Methyltransferase n=1 Tax=Desmophyllum pertusum TaxID=174260 RepID=A0A9X0CCC7_9CNID|nr:hypothetical protein OS493_035170 [Desmophyllum pertusum]
MFYSLLNDRNKSGLWHRLITGQDISKYYSGRLSNLTEKSTDDDVRRVYDDWAHEYDKDLNSAGCVFHKPMVECFDNAIYEIFQGKIAKSDIRIMEAGAADTWYRNRRIRCPYLRGTLGIAHVRPTAFVEMIRMVRNGGLVCFSIRPDGYKEFSEKMAELEHQGKWTLVKEGRVPGYVKEDMPASMARLHTKLIRTD